jgi:hypothetical protein
MKHILSLLLAFVAAGVMGYVLYAFHERLHQIENAFWGTFACKDNSTTPPPTNAEPSA